MPKDGTRAVEGGLWRRHHHLREVHRSLPLFEAGDAQGRGTMKGGARLGLPPLQVLRQRCLPGRAFARDRAVAFLPLLTVLAVLCLLLSMTACAFAPDAPQVGERYTLAASVDVGEIAPAGLSEGQEGIVRLLKDASQQHLLFDYRVPDDCRMLEVWVELYEHGELVDTPLNGELNMDIGQPDEADASATRGKGQPGRIAVTVQRSPKYSWVVAHEKEEGITTIRSTVVSAIEETYMNASAPLSNTVPIEYGKEILLHTSVFADEGNLELSVYTGTPQEEMMDSLALYPYAQLIKCRFS
jgi:hypothetical protein